MRVRESLYVEVLINHYTLTPSHARRPLELNANNTASQKIRFEVMHAVSHITALGEPKVVVELEPVKCSPVLKRKALPRCGMTSHFSTCPAQFWLIKPLLGSALLMLVN